MTREQAIEILNQYDLHKKYENDLINFHKSHIGGDNIKYIRKISNLLMQFSYLYQIDKYTRIQYKHRFDDLVLSASNIAARKLFDDRISGCVISKPTLKSINTDDYNGIAVKKKFQLMYNYRTAETASSISIGSYISHQETPMGIAQTIVETIDDKFNVVVYIDPAIVRRYFNELGYNIEDMSFNILISNMLSANLFMKNDSNIERYVRLWNIPTVLLDNSNFNCNQMKLAFSVKPLFDENVVKILKKLEKCIIYQQAGVAYFTDYGKTYIPKPLFKQFNDILNLFHKNEGKLSMKNARIINEKRLDFLNNNPLVWTSLNQLLSNEEHKLIFYNCFHEIYSYLVYKSLYHCRVIDDYYDFCKKIMHRENIDSPNSHLYRYDPERFTLNRYFDMYPGQYKDKLNDQLLLLRTSNPYYKFDDNHIITKLYCEMPHKIESIKEEKKHDDYTLLYDWIKKHGAIDRFYDGIDYSNMDNRDDQIKEFIQRNKEWIIRDIMNNPGDYGGFTSSPYTNAYSYKLYGDDEMGSL